MDIIQIVFSSDLTAFSKSATTIASVLRRTTKKIEVYFYCQGFLPRSFENERVTVRFSVADTVRKGRFLTHVGSAVFDRLQVIKDAVEWDRCLVMDYDQIALCDLSPLFEIKFGDALLAARRHGEKIDLAYAMEHFRNEQIPKGWEHTSTYPYFCMGPLLNLAAMRRENIWEKVLLAHEHFNAEEQIALTAATGGKCLDYDVKWNLFPDASWCPNVIPEGIIHWTGWPKPWHEGADVWRPDIWEAEETSWEALRNGWWEKPLAVLVEPVGFRAVNALARRGWKVLVVHPREAELEPPAPSLLLTENAAAPALATARAPAPPVHALPDENLCRPFPDVEVIARPPHGGGPEESLPARTRLTEEAGLFSGAALVRFGPGADAARWLRRADARPAHLVLEGPVTAKAWAALRKAGYQESLVLARGDWPAGGPDPAVLDQWFEITPRAVATEEDLYARLPGGK